MAYDIGPFDGGGGLGARRLLALANHLETVGDEDYDHHTWRARRGDGSWVMCALGHAASALPDVVGLRWREPDGADIVRLDGSGITQNTLTLAAEAFELSIDEAAMIFGMGLHTLAFYGARCVSDVRPGAVAAALGDLARAKLVAATAPVGATV